ncbi:MAG: protein kinase [Planctomycetes bacterium]|nr:protein kinase [Planctomycetota bacterium]
MEQLGRGAAPAGSPLAPPGADAGTFGRILLDQGLVTEAQLGRALDIQRERSRRGDFARLGHILVELGFVTPEQVQRVLEAQAIRILACVDCGSQYNVRGYRLQARYECPKCHGALAPAEALKHVAVQDQLEVVAPADDARVELRRDDTLLDQSNTAKIRALRVLGKYQILGEIARGGMGIIYKARQMDLDRVVALKTLRQEELRKPDAAERFRGEAQAVAQLRHPNIVAVHEVGQVQGIEYFTMEFIEGLPLDRLIIRERFSPQRAVEVVTPIAEALEYAHRQNVVHRDLKPGNIILDREGTPFLVDFGIAKRIDKRLERDDEEDLLGSIPYMSPEYVEGAAYDELCDLYSLGVVLYEVLCGHGTLPVYDDDTRRFLEKIVRGDLMPIRQRLPDLDPELARMVDTMIAPRARRYRSMREVVVDLRRWLVQRPAAARGADAAPGPASPGSAAAPAATGSTAHGSTAEAALSRATTSVTRRPVRPPLLAVALALALLGAGLALRQARRDLGARAAQLDAQARAHHDELARELYQQALTLVELDQAPRALEHCTRALERLDPADRPAAAPWPLLGDLYRLRATLREGQGAPGAEDDRRRAGELGG